MADVSKNGEVKDKVWRQGDRDADTVVEPGDRTISSGQNTTTRLHEPSADENTKDSVNGGLSWVQPRQVLFDPSAKLILDRLYHLHASLKSRPAESALAPTPRLLRATMLPHQRHALAWLQWRETQLPAGGILADDMELGRAKTMIALIASEIQDGASKNTDRDKLSRGGTLVVCPSALIQHWANEVSEHVTAPFALSVHLHHGTARSTDPHCLATPDVVITTYNILLRDGVKNGVLARIEWRRIILDKAHKVRNHKSATSTAVSGLHGERRWCLTATQVQNKDLDLFALFKFLRMSPFDDHALWKKWIDNKSQGGQERLNIVMQCIMLRRVKEQLQKEGQLSSLPPHTTHKRLVNFTRRVVNLTRRLVTLTRDEMSFYQKVLVLSKTLILDQFLRRPKKMIALQGETQKCREIMVLLLRVRQVCCHCGLVGSKPGAEPAGTDLRELDTLSLDLNGGKSKKHDEVEEAECQVESANADEAINGVLARNQLVFQLKRPSSKISAVMECLDDVFSNKGDKAVVVSQRTSMLSQVKQELNKKKIRSVTLSSAVTVSQRPKLLDQMNDPKSDVKVMLLSLCSGEVGINQCDANHLLVLDPHWNPQLEQQVQDRIYRLGQNKPVHVYRFVCLHTVEHTIRKLQEAKVKLADNVLSGAGNTADSALSVARP